MTIDMSKKNEKLNNKETIKDKQFKEVIGFTNIQGETMLMGISKTGELAPITDKDNVYTHITKGIFKAISPEVTIFNRFTMGDDGAISVQIGEGSYKPYYLRSEGQSTGHPYIRPGTTTIPALDNVRQMLNDDGDKVITSQMQTAIDKMRANPKISETELQEILQIKRTRFYALISQMVDIGIITIHGRGKNKRYSLKG